MPCIPANEQGFQVRPVIRQHKSAVCCKASTDHVPGRSKSSKPYDVKSVVFKKLNITQKDRLNRRSF